MSFFLDNSKTVFLLIRHGETDWNVQGKMQGHQDIPLNETGIEQAQKLAGRMVENHPDLAHIYCSDLTRAVSTAEMISKKFGLTVSKQSILRELYLGKAEGLNLKEKKELYGDLEKELNERYPDRKDRWKVTELPDAETWEEGTFRVKNFLRNLAEIHPQKKIAIVTHGMLMRTLVADIQDSSEFRRLPNCAVVEIMYSPDDFQVIQVADLLGSSLL